MSKAISSDFLEGDTDTVGLEDEVEPAGIENPMTEDVGRVLRVAGPEAGDEEEEEVGGRKSPAHDFLTVAGTSGTWGTAGVEGVEVWTGSTTLEEEEDSTSSLGGGAEVLSSSLAVSIVVS